MNFIYYERTRLLEPFIQQLRGPFFAYADALLNALTHASIILKKPRDSNVTSPENEKGRSSSKPPPSLGDLSVPERSVAEYGKGRNGNSPASLERLDEDSRTAIISAICSSNLNQVQALVDNGHSINWTGGGALQVALQVKAPSEIATFLVSRGASASDAFLPLFILDMEPAHVDFLIKAGVRVNCFEGHSPPLELMFTCAMIQEKLGIADAADTLRNQTLIRLLLSAGAYSFDLSVKQKSVIRNLTKDSDQQLLPRCDAIVDLLSNLKRDKSRELRAALRFLATDAAPSESTASPWTGAPTSPQTSPSVPPSAEGRLITRLQLLRRYAGDGPDGIDRALALGQKLLSAGRPRNEVADTFLAYAGKLESGTEKVLEFLRSKSLQPSPEILESTFIEACRSNDPELIESLLSLGVDVDCRSSLGLVKVRGLQAAKLLVEHGGNVTHANAQLQTEDPVDRSTATHAYLGLIEKVIDPKSELYFNHLLPQNLQIHNCSRRDTQHRTSFKLLSHCAAAAVTLSMSESTRQILDTNSIEACFRQLVSQSSEELRVKRLRASQIESETSVALNSCRQYISELTYSYIDALVIPTLVERIGVEHTLEEPTKDFFRALRADLFLPTLRWLYKDLSLLELGRAAEKWNRVHHVHPRGNRHSGWWTPLIEETKLTDDVSVCSISRYEDLIKEGEVMGNCLRQGAYVTSCLLGIHHILAIRKNGSSVLNLSLEPTESSTGMPGTDFRIVECKGKNNDKNLSSELVRYADLFRQKFFAGEIAIASGPYGQTAESYALLEETLATPIERILGVELRSSPVEALQFYDLRMRIKSDKRRGYQTHISLPVFQSDTIPAVFEPFIERLRRAP